ncbi:hypothetical protein [Cytobacillus horneckiae]|uniref:Uncharacterized protein n=1 Tax=Cytobacillus horneckiae TaxID=549687 RepID=A0A2N0ZB19_9BACI|nr:hypothetical protein [Cytobacillus horneckiae]MEC1158687.1 hypothetical protein [Cytobacillus horneckiae]NRG46645.1 hypothetical protein [Bacillus sp. CRN 9]PKG26699.1 hypothetical protein CWS20_22905 [Cytobacillus horneckiae]
MEEFAVKNSKRVPFFEIPTIAEHGSLRTFTKKIYFIRGVFAKEKVSGDVTKLSDIYYEIRTVKDSKGTVIAKRKNPTDELIRVSV